MPTIKDVARAAGVSVGTVSNHLNGTTQVAASTAQRIQRAIDDLGYHVHLGARGLRVGASNTIGLVVPNISNPFFGEIARGIEHELTSRGYQTFLCDSSDDPDREVAYLENLANRRVDGALVIYSNQENNPAARHRDVTVPIVYVDRAVAGHTSVTTDNELGGRLVARHLLELRHTRMGLMLGRPDVENVAARFRGFQRELRAHGIDIPEAYIVRGRQTLEFGRDVEQLMSLPVPPTAVFATSDIIAVGAWMALLSHGWRVPTDVSLIGFDDIELSRAMQPSLTTVAQNVPELARHAVERLLAKLPHEGASPRLQDHDLIPIEPRLVIRASTAPLQLPEARDQKDGGEAAGELDVRSVRA